MKSYLSLFLILLCALTAWGSNIPVNFDSSTGNVVNVPPGVVVNFASGKLNVNGLPPLTDTVLSLDPTNNWTPFNQGTTLIALGTSGQFDVNATVTPSIDQEGDGTVHVWYTGYSGSGNLLQAIGHASGPTLNALVKDAGNPVLTKGSGGAWDNAYISGGEVFKDDTTTTISSTTYGPYYMLYFGSQNSSTFEGGPTSIGIAYASSPNGPWTKYASNPILVPGTSGAWDDTRLFRSWITKLGPSSYVLYYNADNSTVSVSAIGYATATTPLGPWTKFASNPVLSKNATGTAWDGGEIGDMQLFKTRDSKWGMVYYGYGTGHNPATGLAYSPTILNPTWVKAANNPVYPINTGAPGAATAQAERARIVMISGQPVAIYDSNASILAAKIVPSSRFAWSEEGQNTSIPFGSQLGMSLYDYVTNNFIVRLMSNFNTGPGICINGAAGGNGFAVQLQIGNTSSSPNSNIQFYKNTASNSTGGTATFSLNDQGSYFQLYDNINSQQTWRETTGASGTSVLSQLGSITATGSISGVGLRDTSFTSGITKFGAGGLLGQATAGTDYQAPITLTTTGTSGAATFTSNTLNIPQYAGTTYTAGTGLTLTTGTFSVNTSQNIATLSNLTGNGFVTTSGGAGTLASSWTIAPASSATSAQAVALTAGDFTGASGVAAAYTIRGGNNTGGGSGLGGNFVADGGTGPTNNGNVVLGATNAMQIVVGAAGAQSANGNYTQIYRSKAVFTPTPGTLGESMNSLIASGSAVGLTTATPANVTSLSLTAGDWEVSGNINFSASTATVSQKSGGIGTTTATVPTDGTEVYSGVAMTLLSATDSITIPTKRINVSSTTTVYMVANCTFTAGSVSAFGSLHARRF